MKNSEEDLTVLTKSFKAFCTSRDIALLPTTVLGGDERQYNIVSIVPSNAKEDISSVLSLMRRYAGITSAAIISENDLYEPTVEQAAIHAILIHRYFAGKLSIGIHAYTLQDVDKLKVLRASKREAVDLFNEVMLSSTSTEYDAINITKTKEIIQAAGYSTFLLA